MLYTFGKGNKMDKELRFSTVLRELPVFLTGEDGTEKEFKLKELNGSQRAKYNQSFDVKVEMDEDGKAKAIAGEGFKSFSAVQFLAMCLYNEDGHPVSEGIIGKYPSTMISELHEAALELSGLNKEALKSAKKESKGSSSNGTE